MTAYQELRWFAIMMIVIWASTILIGFVQRKSHAFTLFNFFLLGSIEFVGISMLALSEGWLDPVSDYTRQELRPLMLGVVIFYITAYVTYFGFGRSAGLIAGRTFLTWPSINQRVLVMFAFLSLCMSAFFYMKIEVPVVSELLRLVGIKSIAFGIVLMFCAWYRDRQNPMLLALLVGFVFYSLLFSITVGGGRRTFITAVAGVPLALYWMRYRNSVPSKTIVIYSVIAVLSAMTLLAYGSIRHRGRGETQGRDFGYALNSLLLIPQRFFDSDKEQFLGQHTIEYSLQAQRIYKRDKSPFHVARFLLSAPIPRRFWEDKPVGLGYMLPKDARARTRATWGPGIVGHAFHEGSYLYIVLYGAIFVYFMRYFDELIARQPENPFLIGTMAAIFPHVGGWVRGDIATFSIQVVSGVLTCALVALFVFQVVRRLSRCPRTDHLSMVQLMDLDRSQGPLNKRHSVPRQPNNAPKRMV
jgi:hypothetical protein